MSGVTTTAPMIPVRMTITAVSAGSPPSRSEIPIATPAVTDFGASDARTDCGMPKAFAIAIADTRAVTEPTTSDRSIGPSARMRRFASRHRERDRRRAEKEVHELRAVEIYRYGVPLKARTPAIIHTE